MLCKICYLRKWRKNSSSDVVLYRYSFKTQTIGFEMIRVRGFCGKFYPKVFKGTNRARPKNMLIRHYPGLFSHVHSAGQIFFLSFWDEKKALILIYKIFVTKIIFFQEWTSKFFSARMFLVDLVGWGQINIYLSLAY